MAGSSICPPMAARNQSRFKVGKRYLAGLPITEENCRHVLINGYQRQRMASDWSWH
jgi:hypothetical protein